MFQRDVGEISTATSVYIAAFSQLKLPILPHSPTSTKERNARPEVVLPYDRHNVPSLSANN
jgi:hypothetical protein